TARAGGEQRRAPAERTDLAAEGAGAMQGDHVLPLFCRPYDLDLAPDDDIAGRVAAAGGDQDFIGAHRTRAPLSRHTRELLVGELGKELPKSRSGRRAHRNPGIRHALSGDAHRAPRYPQIDPRSATSSLLHWRLAPVTGRASMLSPLRASVKRCRRGLLGR